MKVQEYFLGSILMPAKSQGKTILKG